MRYFKRLDVHESFLVLKLFIKNHQKTDSFYPHRCCIQRYVPPFLKLMPGMPINRVSIAA